VEGSKGEMIDFSSPEGLHILRHSTAHLMAQAIKRLYPDAKLGIGPAIEDGFYYDIDLPTPLTPDDLERIEAQMRAIVKEDLPIVRAELPREKAVELFTSRNEPYKVELIHDLPEDAVISTYQQGEFIDLCTGPHVPRTGVLQHFKLTSLAGAYWRGDEHNRMLQRIYGTAYPTQEELDAHMARLEEARRRDHRRLGKELDLFSIQEEAGAGLIFWHPKGALVREIIENFWRAEHRRRGYDIVYSPHIARAELWQRSGHLNWYRENMYTGLDIDGVEYLIKPMNCPFHILMYRSKVRSYRDLPIRWGELGTVYRYERSGALHGLMRVRGFTQDDAHIFCRRDQLHDEIGGVLDLADYMLRSFGFDRYELYLSLRDPANPQKYAGSAEDWEWAQSTLAGVLEDKGLPYKAEEGEAAFYGPKIDIKLIDALGRGWQGPTIQLDFNLPERFDLTYAGQDGQLHRPYMIHRTVLGSMERFFGTLLEHHAGAFPVWLSPVQVVVLPITGRTVPYAREVQAYLRGKDIRADVDDRDDKIGLKIREAQLLKIPYMLVVGDREVENRTVSVRHRERGDLGATALDAFADGILAEIAAKR